MSKEGIRQAAKVSKISYVQKAYTMHKAEERRNDDGTTTPVQHLKKFVKGMTDGSKSTQAAKNLPTPKSKKYTMKSDRATAVTPDTSVADIAKLLKGYPPYPTSARRWTNVLLINALALLEGTRKMSAFIKKVN